jgi:hypothetical protein
MCAYLVSEDKGCRAVCDREALAQTLFRSRSRCACSSRLSTLSSAVTTSRAWPNGRQAAFTGVDATGVVLVSRVRIRLVSACRERGGTGRVVEDLAVPEIALASSTRVVQRCVSSSSICIRDHNASISALSLQSPMGPIDGTSADVRALGKRPGSELRPVVAMDHGFAASRLALLDRHLERVCREGGGRVLAD